jgi:hypothetical protein
MSAELLIEGILNGTIKVAEIDPTLQWGALGAGIGGAGGLVKSLASGDDPKKVLMNALGGAALGGGVGLTGATGARILGAKPPAVSGVLKPKREYRGDFGSAAGTGLIGAGGLLAGAHAEEKRDLHETIRKLIQDKTKGGDLLKAKGEATSLEASDDLMNDLRRLVKTPRGANVRKYTEDQIKELLRAKDVTEMDKFLEAARQHADPTGSVKADRGVGLAGSSPMVEKFKAFLEKSRGDAKTRNVAELLLNKLHSGEIGKLEQFRAPSRATSFLKNFKNPKNLLLAAGGIGLGTYGLTGLGERIWGKKD